MSVELPLEPVWTGTQIRDAEKPLLDLGRGTELMRRASYGLAGVVLRVLRGRGRIYGAKVTGLIGPGNNGGDGLYALAFLRARGVDARAVLVRERGHEEALQAFLRVGGRVVEQAPADTEVLIDAILGTGFRGEFDAPAVPGGAVVVACDLPSGVDGDTGQVRGSAIWADHTVTFGGLKRGLLAGEGGHLSGELHTVPIGIEENLPETQVHVVSESAGVRPAAPKTTDHKYSRGVVHCVAGSPQYPGAALLTASAAAAAGVGMVTFEGPEEVRRQVLPRCPEAVHVVERDRDGLSTGLKKARAAVVGPGLGGEPEQQQTAAEVIRWSVRMRRPCVVDASALTLVPDLKLAPEVLLTPHLGEARTLAQGLELDEAEELLTSDPVGAVQKLAQHTGAAVLLKGATTVVAAPDGGVILHRAEAPGLATAGSGDVLAGLLGATLATQSQTIDVLHCAALAVRLHADAAARLDPQGQGRFGASALASAIGG